MSQHLVESLFSRSGFSFYTRGFIPQLAIEDFSFQQKDEHSRINTWKNVKGGQDGGRETKQNKEVFLPPPLQIWFKTRQNNYVKF